jgi:hypothetical protein
MARPSILIGSCEREQVTVRRPSERVALMRDVCGQRISIQAFCIGKKQSRVREVETYICTWG